MGMRDLFGVDARLELKESTPSGGVPVFQRRSKVLQVLSENSEAYRANSSQI